MAEYSTERDARRHGQPAHYVSPRRVGDCQRELIKIAARLALSKPTGEGGEAPPAGALPAGLFDEFQLDGSAETSKRHPAISRRNPLSSNIPAASCCQVAAGSKELVPS
jgi:hypothetical protein